MLLGHQALISDPTQDLTPSALDASATFGASGPVAANIDLPPTGLDASATLGSSALSSVVDLAPTSLSTPASFGSPTFPLGVIATGVGAAAAFGTPVANAGQLHDVSGLATPASFGNVTASPGSIDVSIEGFGLSTPVTFGVIAMALDGVALPLTFDASATFGNITFPVQAVGLDASATFGAAALGLQASPTGLDVGAAFGAVTLNPFDTLTVTALDASITFGTLVVVGNQALPVGALTASATFGSVTPQLTPTAEPFGLVASPTFGALVVVPDLTLAPTGMDASATFGTPPYVFLPALSGWQIFIRARTNLTGVPDGQLFNVTNLKFLRILNETGAGEISIPLDAADLITNRALLFDSESIIEFQYDSIRRFRMRINAHEVRELGDDMNVTFMGTDFSGELDEMVTVPLNYPIGQGTTREATGSGLAAWATMIGDSQTAGGGELLTLGFGANDSNTVPWPSTTNIDAQIVTGTTMRAAAEALIVPGEADWYTDPDGVLQALPSVGLNRSEQVHLRVGVHQLSRTARTTRRRVVNQALILGTDGSIEANENSASSTAYGGRQTVLSVNTTNVADRQTIAAAVTSAKGDPIASLDVVTRAFRQDHALWADWDLGDTISIDVEGIRNPSILAQTARVSAYVVESDLIATTVEVVLGDSTEILEATFDKRLQRVLNAQGIGLGAVTSLSALIGITPGETGIDPTGLTVNNRGGAAVDESALQISWTAPAGTGAGQVVAYEVEVDDGIEVEIRRERTSQTNDGVFGLIPNTSYDVRVWALNILGERVGSVQKLGHLTDSDTTLPAQVDAVLLLGVFSALRVVWNANTEPDVANNRGHYRVQVDSDSLFGTPDLDFTESATIANLTGLTPQTLYFVRVAAIDSSGNQGPWSVVVNTSAGQVGSGDIEDDAIIQTKIADLAVGNANIQALAVGTAEIQSLAVTSAQIANATITFAQIEGGTITSALIQDGTILGSDIRGGTITGSNIMNGTITGTQIEGGTITGAEIRGGTIEGSHINGATLTGANIISGTIGGIQIGDGEIGNGHINNGAISGVKITSNTIFADQIAANAIGTSELAANSINVGHITAGTLSASNIETGTINVAVTLTAATITAGTISGTTITGNTISGGTITGTTINGGTFVGGTILIGTGSDKFGVNSLGQMFCNGSSFASSNWTVDVNGEQRMLSSLRFGTSQSMYMQVSGSQFTINATHTSMSMLLRSTADLQIISNSGRILLGLSGTTRTLNLYGTDVRVPNIVNTGNSANMRISNTLRTMLRFTSLSKYKDDQQPIPLSEAMKLLDVPSITWRSNLPSDDPDIRLAGHTAEGMFEHGPLELVDRDDDGSPVSVHYDREGAYLKVLVGELFRRLEAAGV